MVDVGRREDRLLDELFTLYRNRDEAVRLLGKLVLANPALDEPLTAVVMRLANTSDGLTPVGFDSFGAEIYKHQLQE